MKRIATLIGIALMTAAPTTGLLAQQSAPASPAALAQPSLLVGSDSLVGSTVRNSDGRDIGKVNRLMIDPSDGRVTTVVIATGGTLGMGSNTISLPWSSVKIGQDNGKVIITASQTLEPAPKADRSKDTAPPSSGTDPAQRRP